MADSIKLDKFEPVREDEKTEGETTTPSRTIGRRTPGRTVPEEGAAVPRGRRIVPPTPTPTLPEFGPGGRAPLGGAVAGEGGAAADLPPLIPTRPLADESPVGDRAFRITWTVELLSPEEVRQREDAARAADQPAADASPASDSAGPAIASTEPASARDRAKESR